jgi:hypothetical protein
MNGEIGQAMREKFWEEKTDSEKIKKLGECVEILGRRVLQLEKENGLLSQHQHDSIRQIVVPLVQNEKEIPWYYSHLLGKGPKL